MITYYDAVLNLVGPGVGGPIDGPISSFDFPDGVTPPTEEQVQAKLKELEADFDSKQYQRDRASVYPSIQEQLDMQYWDAVNGTKKWQEAVAKVKTDNPKPE